MKNTIAVCIALMDENFQADSLQAIYRKAQECGISVQVYNTFEALADYTLYDMGEESIYDLINYERLCGMIVFCEKIKDNELNRRLIESGHAHGIPVVCIDRYEQSCYSITFDYKNSFEKIVRHLVEEHDCEKFYMMAGFRDNSFSDERIAAVRKVLREYGLELNDEDIGYGDFWTDPTRKVMQEFLRSGRPLPDAFVAANDTMAICICNELADAGYQVPKDTIVTGFDGIEMERYVVPRLTTAQQNIDMCGATAVDIIERVRRGGKYVEKEHVIPFAIRHAQSCGCQPLVHSSVSHQIHNLYNKLTGHRQFQRFMYDMIIEMTSKESLTDMMWVLEKYVAYLTGYEHLYVMVREDLLLEDDEIMGRLAHGTGMGCTAQDMVVLGEWHAKTGFSVPLRQFTYDEQIPDYENVIKEIKHVIYVPLHMQDAVFGYMVLNMKPGESEYSQISAVATNLSHCLDSMLKNLRMYKMNEKLQAAKDKLEKLYITDPLTGIYNRRGFYQELNRRLERQKGWLMMLSVDMDGLKMINDCYGHSEGDFAIKVIGEIIRDCTKERGVCARFGGDEFAAAIFFKDYAEAETCGLIQRIDECLRIVNERVHKPYRIAASCGSKIGKIDENLDYDALLKGADNQMYVYKEQHHCRSRMRERARVENAE